MPPSFVFRGKKGLPQQSEVWESLHSNNIPYFSSLAANLEQRLNTIQEEHMQELKVLQMEARMLCQQLSESREEEEKARDQVQRLSAALEIATATKVPGL